MRYWTLSMPLLYFTKQTWQAGITVPYQAFFQFPQLALLNLSLLVICPVPQNKIIYTGGLLALGKDNSSACQAVLCAAGNWGQTVFRQTVPSKYVNQKGTFSHFPASAERKGYCFWWTTTDKTLVFKLLWHLFWLLRHQFLLNYWLYPASLNLLD